MILNLNLPNYFQNIKTKIKLQGEIDKITLIMRGFNASFAIIDSLTTQ